MPFALWTLLWLNFRGFLRKTGRQLRSPRGIVFFLIGMGMICLWLGPQLFLNRKVPPADPQAILSLAPLVLLLLCVLNLFTAATERAVTFTPAEVGFLFPGPFSRRSLLIYKLIKTGLGSVISAMIFGIVAGRFGGSYVFRVFGIWILFQFMQLLAMTLAMLQSFIGERFVKSGRWWILLGLALATALAVLEVYTVHHELNLTLAMELQHTIAGRVVLAPFTVLARVLVARSFTADFLPWASVALAMDLLLAGFVIVLDTNYLEMSANASAKRYERLSRIRRSGLTAAAKPASARWKIPMLPWLGGAGPIIWRQLTIALRTARGLLITLAIVALVVGIGVSRLPDNDNSIGFLVAMLFWLNLFLSQMLKFDFRGDLDYLDVLRSLPLTSTAVAAAQLVAPSVVQVIVQMLLLVTIALLGDLPPVYLLMAAAFLVPLNILTIAADNLMFLVFPFRPTTAVAGDMSLIGRQAVVFACRTLLLVIIGGFSAGVGVGTWYLSGRSLPIAAIAGWIPLPIAIVLMTILIAAAFRRFDPSVSTPT